MDLIYENFVMIRDQVFPMACACAAIGADGILIEVHNKPEKAQCDGAQSLYPDQFAELMGEINTIHNIVEKNKGKRKQYC